VTYECELKNYCHEWRTACEKFDWNVLQAIDSNQILRSWKQKGHMVLPRHQQTGVLVECFLVQGDYVMK
jgi:hypothetical protein